jgi:hypothetical protein
LCGGLSSRSLVVSKVKGCISPGRLHAPCLVVCLPRSSGQPIRRAGPGPRVIGRNLWCTPGDFARGALGRKRGTSPFKKGSTPGRSHALLLLHPSRPPAFWASGWGAPMFTGGERVRAIPSGGPIAAELALAAEVVVAAGAEVVAVAGDPSMQRLLGANFQRDSCWCSIVHSCRNGARAPLVRECNNICLLGSKM